MFERLIRRAIRRTVREFLNPSVVVKKVKVKQEVQNQTVAGIITTTEVVTQIETIRGRAHVIDGDTIVIGEYHIRLAGIDAPELHNPYGKQAKWAMVNLCKGQHITAHLTGETSYNRYVAKCFLDDGRDLAAEMVKLELALDIPHFPNADYKHLETPNARRKLTWRPKQR
jgi:micrococcal nuclease